MLSPIYLILYPFSSVTCVQYYHTGELVMEGIHSSVNACMEW